LAHPIIRCTIAGLAFFATACRGPGEAAGPERPDVIREPTSAATDTTLVDDEPLFSSYRQPARCVARPEPSPTTERPSWLPARLPLPKGSYVVGELAPQKSHYAALLAVPMTLEDWASLVRERWVERGVVLGRRESEPGETEAAFVDGEVFGAYRARNLYCEEGWVQVLVIYGRQSDEA
jgi:hypothetical protein